VQVPGLSQKKIIGLLVAGLVALATWFLQGQGISVGGDGQAQPAPTPSASQTAAPSPSYEATPSTGATAAASPTYDDEGGDADGGTDPESGLAWVSLDRLPPEAAETVELIEAGGPFPHDRDGITFHNYEGILPDRQEGYYREYTVPTPGLDHRGARRVVTGSSGEYYWTEDHYASFERI
jgi:ribonuclease T1